MSIINKGTAFSNGEQLSANKLNSLVDGATFGTDSVDNASTIVNANGAITVRDSGVTAAKLAAGAVTTNKILDANVTTAKIADANVTFAKLTDVIDDDTMATATDTTLATSESIKAYVDSISYTPNIVQTVKTDTFVQLNPQGAWFDIPDFSLSITPTSSSSNVLISADVLSTSTNINYPTRFRFVRDGVAIALGDADGTTQQCSFTGSNGSAYTPCSGGMSYLDSTAVVAGTPVVYKIQVSNFSTVGIYINRGTSANTQPDFGRTISTLIATEIPQ